MGLTLVVPGFDNSFLGLRGSSGFRGGVHPMTSLEDLVVCSV